jgi:hypothetical protein
MASAQTAKSPGGMALKKAERKKRTNGMPDRGTLSPRKVKHSRRVFLILNEKAFD